MTWPRFWSRKGLESLSVLRKTGRSGWTFFTKQVLPHKKKLAAAGVLAAFLANPEEIRGLTLARRPNLPSKSLPKLAFSSLRPSAGARAGLETSIGQALAALRARPSLLRYLAFSWLGWLPSCLSCPCGRAVRLMFRPFRLDFRLFASVFQDSLGDIDPVAFVTINDNRCTTADTPADHLWNREKAGLVRQIEAPTRSKHGEDQPRMTDSTLWNRG